MEAAAVQEGLWVQAWHPHLPGPVPLRGSVRTFCHEDGSGKASPAQPRASGPDSPGGAGDGQGVSLTRPEGPLPLGSASLDFMASCGGGGSCIAGEDEREEVAQAGLWRPAGRPGWSRSQGWAWEVGEAWGPHPHWPCRKTPRRRQARASHPRAWALWVAHPLASSLDLCHTQGGPGWGKGAVVSLHGARRQGWGIE